MRPFLLAALLAVCGCDCHPPAVPAPEPGCDRVVATLPAALHESSALSDGESIFVIGGAGLSYSDQLQRFDPASMSLTTLPERLPSPRQAMAGVWTGAKALLFGGRGPGPTLLDEIVEWTPGSAPVRKSARLPTGRYNIAAVWTGSVVYLFGGWSWAGDLRDLLVYDPVADRLTVLPGSLPDGRQAANAFFDGSAVWVVGGVTAGTGAVLKLDPATGTLSSTSMLLPDGMWDTAPLWDGARAWLLGGLRAGAVSDRVLAFDPSVPSLEELDKRLPVARTTRSAALLGGRGYILGGADSRLEAVDTVVCFGLP